MNTFRFLMASAITIMVISLGVWIYKVITPLPIAPRISMIQNCDSMTVVTRINNYEDKSITCSYSVYMDVNDNKSIDSMDVLLRTVPQVTIGPQAELVDMPISPLFKYKGYSLIVKLSTEKLVTYYLSIPCAFEIPDSTPTK